MPNICWAEIAKHDKKNCSFCYLVDLKLKTPAPRKARKVSLLVGEVGTQQSQCLVAFPYGVDVRHVHELDFTVSVVI